MKRALVTFVVFALIPAGLAVAQEGSSSGPPKKPVIIIPSPLPTPTPTSPSVPRLSELEQR